VRWRPLSTRSPKRFLEVLHHSLQHVGRNCCHFFPDLLFQIHRCPWFLIVHLALEISSEEEVLRLGTLVPMNIKVLTKYPVSQDWIVVFEIRLHRKSPMLYRPALHGNWNALSLAIGDCLVCGPASRPARIPDNHLYRVTNTRCRIGTVIFSWWWAHSCPKHVQKSNNILRKFVHQVGSIHEINPLKPGGFSTYHKD